MKYYCIFDIFIALILSGIVILHLTIINFVPININSVNKLSNASYILADDDSLVSELPSGAWNVVNSDSLNRLPMFLKNALLVSEDQKFYSHSGVDWKARLAALFANVKAGHVVRGASTVSEQVVKMVHKRHRNIWSRWIEGVESQFWLEKHFSKEEILEFYVNQVPFSRGIRGFINASKYYFNRDISSLNFPEMLTLVVMIRSPSKLDIHKHSKGLKKSVFMLANKMLRLNLINQSAFQTILQYDYNVNKVIKKSSKKFLFYNFTRYVNSIVKKYHRKQAVIKTSLNVNLQKKVSSIILNHLHSLKKYNAHDASVVVVNAKNGEVLSWVSVSNKSPFIDGVLIKRQGASVMKPFLYATSFEKGATPATLVEDLPMTEMVKYGLHNIRNYSGLFYQKLPIKYALGNSLNVPSVHILQFIKPQIYIEYLKNLGFDFSQDYTYYGNGLGLGVAEISLFELVQAYTIFANSGCYLKLQVIKNNISVCKRVFSDSSVLSISNILSNKFTRVMEFGDRSVLNFPIRTSVKTGTSADYRDSWAVGFDDNYIVGIWVGNFNNKAMRGITGSVGAGFPLRSIFFELNKFSISKKNIPNKNAKINLLIKKTNVVNSMKELSSKDLNISTGLIKIAIDPRIPVNYQAFRFNNRQCKGSPSDWFVDGNHVYTSINGHYDWFLKAGRHSVRVVPKQKDCSERFFNMLVE